MTSEQTSEELRSKAKEKRDLALAIASGTAGSATHLIVDAEHFEAAADEIDRLRQRVAMLEEWVSDREAVDATAVQVAAERDALRKRVEELERAAKRYQYVKQRMHAEIWERYGGEDRGYSHMDIDAAIDAAMEAKQWPLPPC